MAEELASTPVAASPRHTYVQTYTHDHLSFVHILTYPITCAIHKSHTHSDDTPISTLTGRHTYT